MSAKNKTADLDPALPPGTSSTDGWQQDDDGRRYRPFAGADRRIEGMAIIGTSGCQLPDGNIDTDGIEGGAAVSIWAGVGTDALSVEQARRLAQAILDAVADVEDWISGADRYEALIEFQEMRLADVDRDLATESLPSRHRDYREQIRQRIVADLAALNEKRSARLGIVKAIPK